MDSSFGACRPATLDVVARGPVVPASSRGPTCFVTYGGPAGGMGKPGSFDDPKMWFGFKKEVLRTDAPLPSANSVFQGMLHETTLMRAAIACPFPIPKFKPSTEKLDDAMAPTELEEIARLDSEMMEPNKPDKVPTISSKMEPRAATFESQGEGYYLYGPFQCRENMMENLKQDPMLKPVADKWSKFESSVLDAMFSHGTAIYLQIRWQGWFVRPVVELTESELARLLSKARFPETRSAALRSLQNCQKQSPPSLFVDVVAATGLAQMNHFTSDHFYVQCEVKHLNRHERTTKAATQPMTVGDTMNPFWNERLEIQPWHPGEDLEFTIYDKGLVGARTQGKVSLTSANFYPQGYNGRLPIKGLPSAFLHVAVQPADRATSTCGASSGITDAAQAAPAKNISSAPEIIQAGDPASASRMPVGGLPTRTMLA